MVNAAEGNKRMSTDSGMVGDGGTAAADLSSDSIEATMERELIERNGIPTHVGEQFADALQDPRFADNPLVTGPSRVRFYAGAPVAAADGSLVGSLCIIDHRARQLDADQLALLRDLAKLVESELSVPFVQGS